MARAATDADFNGQSRYLEVKLEIFFDGIGGTPLSITKADYLIDADWLEEGSAESSNPFGNVSSGELNFRLFNKNGMFSPTNTAGPYYGKIKTGTPVKLFIKPIYDNEEVEWTQLGKYYVTGWDAAVTGTYADIVANDEWYHIFSSPLPNYPVGLNKTYRTFLTEVLLAAGYVVDVDALLTTILPYAFVDGSTQEFLKAVTAAALAYVTCTKTGDPKIGAFIAPRLTRATLTDSDQIKSISAKQSIIKSYNGVELKYSVPQVGEPVKLIDLVNVPIINGPNELTNIAFNNGPLWQISSISLRADNDDITLNGFTATPWSITVRIDNNSPSLVTDMSVAGKILNLTDVVMADNVSKLLKVSSKYIQNQSYATYYNTILKAFVSNNTPLLSLSVRGNPLLNIGDKVIVHSDKYNVAFTGVIQRMAYKYAGSLSCEMVLLNMEVLQGVGA